MYTVELECESGHAYEGWYDSADDYEGVLTRGELSCPVCDSEFVMRKSSVRTPAGKALMTIARRIQNPDKARDDQVGGQYFKLLLD